MNVVSYTYCTLTMIVYVWLHACTYTATVITNQQSPACYMDMASSNFQGKVSISTLTPDSI